MFDKAEIKEFAIKLGRRYIFPDFSNRITWAIVTLGTAIILTPTPLKVVFYNWLVDSINLNSGNYFTLAELMSDNADYWIGLVLIIVALTHNVICKYMELEIPKSNAENLVTCDEADKILFQRFLAELPSGSRSIYFLETHDFGNPFSLDSLKEIDKFIDSWGYAETTFLSTELEELKQALYKKTKEFDNYLAMKSSPISVGRQSVVPDQHRNDWNWPEWVNEEVRKCNELSSELVQLHQEFIFKGKQLLRC